MVNDHRAARGFSVWQSKQERHIMKTGQGDLNVGGIPHPILLYKHITFFTFMKLLLYSKQLFSDLTFTL